MFGDCFLRFSFLRRCISSDGGGGPLAAEPEPDLDPVLLVSGMGGSILNTRNKKNSSTIRVWIRILLANLEFKKYLWSLYNPESGSPGYIYNSLITGLQFVYGFESFFFVSRWTMHQLLVECPSIYELLPNPDFEWKNQPVIQVWRKLSEDNEVVKMEEYDSSTFISLFEEALKNNEMNYNGKSISLPFNFYILQWATNTRKIIDDAQLPDSVRFYSIYSTSYKTPHDVWKVTEIFTFLVPFD